MTSTYIKIDSPYSLSPNSPERGERNLLFSSSPDLGNLSPGWSPSGSPGGSPCGHHARYVAMPATGGGQAAVSGGGRPVSLLINASCTGSALVNGGGGGVENSMSNEGTCNLVFTPAMSTASYGTAGGPGSDHGGDESSRASSISLAHHSCTQYSQDTHLLPPKPKPAAPETYIFLALVVAFFFNLPFGLVAMCVSLRAKRVYEEQGESGQAERLATVSLCVSLVGIFVSAAAIAATIFLVIDKN